MSQVLDKRNGLSVGQVRSFRKAIRDFYQKNKRDLPWRRTTHPYHILVSEIMLQQTQVDRVIGKYNSFIKRFPTARKLAQAPLIDVLSVWQGLGYNRRARYLCECARTLIREYNNSFPREEAALVALPGVGTYTARAIQTFAFNLPVVLIETNIRSVYIHNFFNGEKKVMDAEILPLIAQTVDRRNPREWYAALMDYGSYIKEAHGNPNRKSAHYSTQSRFEGSRRQLRGKIISELIVSPRTVRALSALLEADMASIAEVIQQLEREKIIRKKGTQYVIA